MNKTAHRGEDEKKSFLVSELLRVLEGSAPTVVHWKAPWDNFNPPVEAAV